MGHLYIGPYIGALYIEALYIGALYIEALYIDPYAYPYTWAPTSNETMKAATICDDGALL